MRGYWECRAAHMSAKAYVDIPALELMDVEFPGVVGGGMSGWNACSESPEPLASCRSAPATVKAFHISRSAMKLGCAREWGGWGRISVDGPGQHNLDRSEGPWSRATHVARMAVFHRAGGPPTQSGGPMFAAGSTKDGSKPASRDGHAGSQLNRSVIREGPSDRPALEPY